MLRARSCQSRRFRPAPQRRLWHSCTHDTTRMLGGARRPRPPNYLAMACRVTSQLIRLIERMRKREPHLFDYAAIQREAAWKAEVRRALDRVYGAAPSQAGPPAKCSPV